MGGRSPLVLGALATLIACFPAESQAHRSDLHAVAIEGEVLPDGTTLQSIIAPCSQKAPFRPCLALSVSGRVIFYGTTGDGIFAIFSERSLMFEEGDALPDGTILALDDTTIVGGLAHSIRELGFPGKEVDPTSTTNALFTPQGAVVSQGEILPDGTVISLNLLGGLTINLREQVAFHGSNAVFNQDGVMVAARQILPDGVEVAAISPFGGIASRGPLDSVAFHGFTDNKQAIFTQEGLVTRVGTLPDGTELQSIDLFGGIAVNPRGEVALHGRTEGYDGVFSQYGLLARAGTRLHDGSKLEAIRPEGGIAINRSGRAAFHGDIPGAQAVLSQYGVVAKVGDRVRDGGTLEAILAEGGIAIDQSGRVAFHGVTYGKPALFVAR